jgi:hypothetical protein
MKITTQKFNFHFGEKAVYQLCFIDEIHQDVTVILKDAKERVGKNVDAMRSTV